MGAAPWWLVSAVVVLVVVLGGAVAMWLLGVWAPIPQNVQNPEQLRLDRIKTGLTVAAGLWAACVTLFMTERRHALNERAQRLAEMDALEQQKITQYVAAAEQLANDMPTVRLAGLYALARLGQRNPDLRQTVVDVWCGYLRMPFKLGEVPHRVAHSLEGASEAGLAGDGIEAMSRQELQVRLGAQNLLRSYLAYWVGPEGERMDVDLVSAELVEFNLSNCRLGRLNLSTARLHGRADFSGAHFQGGVSLRDAHFYGGVDLREAQFYSDVDLTGSEFHSYADLAGAKFHGTVNLLEAKFHGEADSTRA